MEQLEEWCMLHYNGGDMLWVTLRAHLLGYGLSTLTMLRS